MKNGEIAGLDLRIVKGPQYPPVYQQIVDQLRGMIAKGLLKQGEQLPTIKELCGELQVNPNTVARAYLELERAGIVEGRRGGGTTINTLPPLAKNDKNRKLTEIVTRALAEAGQFGLTAKDIKKQLTLNKKFA